MSTPMMAAREAVGELPNPLGLQGVEFIEYATSRPQALGQALERMGFQPVARHRSREVLLYRQGDMNIIVNAHQDSERTGLHAPPALTEAPVCWPPSHSVSAMPPQRFAACWSWAPGPCTPRSK